jgi:regulator of protease activity HflC (stomatin/prohibitin superfamily)
MTDDPTPTPNPEPNPESGSDQTFTQADVDRIVRERVKREREKFADYDDLKKRAEGATTLEERVAGIERQAKESEERAMRAEVANAKGLTPTQAKRLVGETREELEADADELLETFKPTATSDDDTTETVVDSLDLGNRSGSPKKGKSTADLFAAAIDGSFTR